MRSHGNGHHSPIEETLAALAIAAGGGGVHHSADNTAPVDSDGVTPVVLVSITITPAVSGKFTFVGSAIIENGADAGTYPAILLIGHGANVVDYTQGVGTSIPDTDIRSNSINADNNLTGMTFPVGVPVTLLLMLMSSAPATSSLVVPAHGAQLTVVEMAH